MTKEKPFNASIFAADDFWTRRYHETYATFFRKGQSVLDIGCGSGIFLKLLQERGVDGTGIDSSEDAVARCREQNLHAILTDAMKYLSECGTRYDGVFCSHIVEHIQPDTLMQLLDAANRILKPGGKIIIITPHFGDISVMSELFWLDISHVRPYPLPLLRLLLEHAGFTILRGGLDPNTKKNILVAIRKRLARLFSNRTQEGSMLAGHAPVQPRRNPVAYAFEYFVNKLRFGKYYDTGDTFVIAQKPVQE